MLKVAMDDPSRLEDKLGKIHCTVLDLPRAAERTFSVRVAGPVSECVFHGHAG